MSWKEILELEFSKDYFKSTSEFLSKEYANHTIYPRKTQIFEAFNLCPLDQTRVVILGQDCYHQPNQAHGLAFSVNKGIKIPPSLRNIYKEINSDVNFKIPEHGCLTEWAKQGILLLNSALTVRHGEPGSHIEIWEPFTKEIIKIINRLEQPIVFLLWGSFARSKKYLITNSRHLILEASHPSPFSAYSGFMGCKHFSKTNDFLIKNKLNPINWQL